MKLLALLLVVIAAAYFAPAPISHVQQSIEITAPRDRVWSVLADVSSVRLWDPAMKDVKILSELKTGEGVVRAASSPLAKTTERVTEWIAYNRITCEVTHEPKLTKFETSTVSMEPGSGSGITRITWSLDYQMAWGYLGHFGDKIFFGSLHAGRVSEGLSNLKRYAETGEAPM